MTEPRATVGAPPAWAQEWESIDWAIIHRKVKRLQMRIAKAVRENDWGKVRSLQRILTRSTAAKLWATRRVVTNRGKRTPGVDGVTWTTSRQKLQAARSLGRRGYRPQPLRRISIPKKNGKRRPLSIPTMRDRAMQALHLLALSPIAETLADEHSYGFRLERSIADAHGQCFIVLGKIAERGLRLSPEKSRITHIEAGFDFLGANVRKVRGKLLMRPAKDGVQRLLKACRDLLRQLRAAPTTELIRRLNAKLRGWAHQFRHLVSWRTFRYIDHCIFVALKAWVRRRHPKKNAAWRREKYFHRLDGRARVFSATYRDAQGALRRLVLVRTASLGLRRHAKILGRANPFDPAYSEYFRLRCLRKRRERREARTRTNVWCPAS